MKKYILMPLLAVFALTAAAQDFDTDPTLQLENAEKEVKFTVGARMMADAAERRFNHRCPYPHLDDL